MNLALGRFRIEVPLTGGVAVEILTGRVENCVGEKNRSVEHLDLVRNSDALCYRVLQSSDRFRLEIVEPRPGPAAALDKFSQR